MADSTKVWVSTTTIHNILHPKDAHGHKRLGMHGSLGGEDDAGTINWGWTSAIILSGGHSGSDGTLDGSAPVSLQVEDPESEYNRLNVEVPGKAIEDGMVVMQNFHGDEDDDSALGYDDSDSDAGANGPITNFNGDEAQGYPDDMVMLTHLHEPAVVHCLRKRYGQDKIYTNTGPILIALNPFKSCKTLYSDGVMRQYWERGEAMMLMGGGGGGGGVTKKNNGDDDEDNEGGNNKTSRSGGVGEEELLPPHVYDLADATYRSMLLKMDVEGGSSSSSSGASGCNQSILVSGESGAGKTVTTKFIMQYLATLSQRMAEAKANGENPKTPTKPVKGSRGKARPSLPKEQSNTNVNIEQQVLQSNPILESFGNARTIRNDNSSRFGKFIEIKFNPKGTLVGASVETYLLEKVRLISQSEGERNYHVFYEMLCGMTDEDLDQYLLGEYTAEDFRITSCSGTYDRRDGVKDTDTYEDLVDALEVMGFTPEQQNDVFSIASAVLHLSNLSINPIKGGEECEIDSSNEHLEPILELLGVTAENLNQALCYFKIEARGQSYTRAVQKDKAEKGLEALIKATYSAMFDFIVKRINSSITAKKKKAEDGGGGGGKSRKRSGGGGGGDAVIGVLDIFGFESFKTNSFEQLCINYCNEALQQQFNLFVLKNEQDEYEQEGIKWSFISFPDNQEALDLIWKKGYGILNILDDQCRAPGTTDKTFANDLYQKLTNKPRFEANFRQVGARQFGVFHYAGLVEYDTEGFTEKNKDELPREATDLLNSSSSEFVKELASIISSASAPEPTKSVPGRGGKKKSVTVGGHFASQLQTLRAKIDLTSPHYVRCLKPNGQLVPDNFDPLMIVEQLRCAGVVEAVRVSRVGYPQRYNHSQFVSRYRTLGLREMKKAAKSSSRKVKPVVALVDAIAKKMVDIIDKSPQSPSKKDKKSSSSSSEKVDLLAVGIQVGKTKVFLRRKAFDILEKMRKDYMATAAIKVQAIARGYIHQRNFQEYCESNLQLQCWFRVVLAQRKVQVAREWSSARKIQSVYRRHTTRTVFLSVLAAARWCQRMQRGALGRARCKELSQLRRAAIVIQCAIRIHWSRRELEKCKSAAKDLQNVAEERDKFRERMEHMRLEMERVKLAAEKEAEEAAKARSQVNARDESDAAGMQEELARLKDELANTQAQLDEERQRSQKSSDLAESRQVELESSQEEVSQLQTNLEQAKEQAKEDSAQLQTDLEQAEEQAKEAKEDSAQLQMDLEKAQEQAKEAKANSDDETPETEMSPDSSKEMLLQNKLDEALILSRKRENDIKKLKSELKAMTADVASKSTPQSAESTTNASSTEIDELQAEVSTLRTELESTKKKLSKAQQSSNDVAGPSHDELQNEIVQLRDELEEAMKHQSLPNGNDSSGYTSLSSVKELNDLKEENEKLRAERDLALAAGQSSAASVSESVSTSKTEKKLKKDIAKLKEANRKILEMAESQFASLSGLENENAELKSEIKTLREVNAAGADPNSHVDMKASLAKAEARLKAEKTRAESAVAREAKLRTEVAEYRLKGPQSNGDTSLMSNQTISEVEPCDDIATLQYEIERLSNELLVAKEEARSTDTFSADDMIRKYDELKHLAEAGMQKDLEMEKLKMRVKTQEAELKNLREEVTEEDLTFGMREYREEDEDVAAAENEGLRSLNEELSKQLVLYKEEAEDSKAKLKEEATRSEMELKAFSVALSGVDDLRVSAEHMSRELHYIKRNGYVPPGGLTGEDTSEQVKSAMSAMETMAKANQTIDHPAIVRNQPVQQQQQQQGFSLWNAMNAVMSPGQTQTLQTVTESTGGLFNDQPEKKASKHHKSSRRKKNKRSDSGSIISSFF